MSLLSGPSWWISTAMTLVPLTSSAGSRAAVNHRFSLVPVMAVIGGALLLGEAVGMREIAALGFVIAGIALVLMPQRFGTKV